MNSSPKLVPPAQDVAVGWLCLRMLAVWLCVALAHSAHAAHPGPAEAASTQSALLYHNYCSVCHGDKGDGKSRASGSLSTVPRDFTSEASRRELTRERIILAIAHGRPGTAMVGWKTQLSDTDIARLADYVLSQFVQREARADVRAPQAGANTAAASISGTRAHGGREADAASTSAGVDMTTGFPNGLKGDLKRGSAFYLANCATCHGTRGDGAGPRAYFINPKPRDFTHANARAQLNRVVLFAAVSEGRLRTEMPAWKQVANAQQIADVAEYVFQTFIRAAPASAANETAVRK